jgi:AcrR family transcriptional regulator
MTEPGWRDCEPLDLSPTLSGALAAFREHGYHGTTVRDVARRVGVTVPALYYHHGSKQGMLVALFDVAMADLLQRVELALADAGVDPQMRFRNIVEAIALHMTYRRNLAMIDSELRYLDPESRAHYVAQRDKVQRLLNKAISDGSKVGIFHVAHPVDTTRALLGMLLAIATWYRADGRLSPTQLAERYVEIALNTVGFTRRPRR